MNRIYICKPLKIKKKKNKEESSLFFFFSNQKMRLNKKKLK